MYDFKNRGQGKRGVGVFRVKIHIYIFLLGNRLVHLMENETIRYIYKQEKRGFVLFGDSGNVYI